MDNSDRQRLMIKCWERLKKAVANTNAKSMTQMLLNPQPENLLAMKLFRFANPVFGGYSNDFDSVTEEERRAIMNGETTFGNVVPESFLFGIYCILFLDNTKSGAKYLRTCGYEFFRRIADSPMRYAADEKARIEAIKIINNINKESFALVFDVLNGLGVFSRAPVAEPEFSDDCAEKCAEEYAPPLTAEIFSQSAPPEGNAPTPLAVPPPIAPAPGNMPPVYLSPDSRPDPRVAIALTAMEQPPQEIEQLPAQELPQAVLPPKTPPYCHKEHLERIQALHARRTAIAEKCGTVFVEIYRFRREKIAALMQSIEL